ncbi:TldD/PmbA family protein [Clostridium sp. 19966]|uniref:TldD/PmbA family protein n=1 Tax=Clostridium sp. 19966 TaxID=2768166 RepID=UPI0028DDAF43|nr:TldD/PmbA family protein [Clostridium sp. 19966]MDT8717865.1 TldD/PmbA family protein [Clostridium sp. 19966]
MTLEEFKKAVFEKAELVGFSEYEIYYSSENSLGVQVFEGEIDKYTVSGEQGLSFRGVYEGKMGYAYTEILDEEAVNFVVNSAKENALIIEKEDKEIIYVGDDKYSQFEGFEEKLSKTAVNEKIKLAFDLETEAKKLDDSVIRTESEMEEGENLTQIVNSKGLNLSFKSNVIFAFVEAIVKDGERMNADYAFKAAKSLEEIDAKELAKEAVDSALAYKGAKTVKSGKYKVALKNDIAANLLQTFSGVFSADNAQKGMSLLKDKLGETIGGKAVTILDDPFLKEGLNSRPFDAEGVAAYTKEVVKEGELKTLLHNLKTAAKEGVKSTGNASKMTYSSPVEVAPSNFYFKPGKNSYEEILKVLENGILITELQGLHSGANPVSGDFSLAAKGLLIKDGSVERPIEQITVSGNFYEVLKDIEELGSDLKFGFPSGRGYFGSPTIVVKELSIAGE